VLLSSYFSLISTVGELGHVLDTFWEINLPASQSHCAKQRNIVAQLISFDSANSWFQAKHWAFIEWQRHVFSNIFSVWVVWQLTANHTVSFATAAFYNLTHIILHRVVEYVFL
jgi:hypothetical protein